jgi:negative modulator of initiation of replication
MLQIAIDSQVHAELSRRAIGFNVTPNDVLRQILNLPQIGGSIVSTPASPPAVSLPSTLTGFLQSERFQRHNQAVDRYLVLLSWLHTTHGDDFVNAALKFRRGSRPHFARAENDIVSKAQGSTARQIPQCPIWALTTLDNKSKRLVWESILTALSYSRSEISAALAELPDSGIRRGQNRIVADLLASI